MNKRNSKVAQESFGPFNLSDFKKWMETQHDTQPDKNNMIDVKVVPKVTFRKLLTRIDVQDGEVYEVAKDFKKNGGIISDIDGENILIECDTGTFIINRMLCKRL
jgi:hypothetical protein